MTLCQYGALAQPGAIHTRVAAMRANNQPPCPTLPDDAVASVLAHLGLRELHLCAQLSAAWRVQANARRNGLRLLQHESAYGVRGNSKDKLHNARSLALVGGGAALLVTEEKRVRLLRPLGAGETESFASESESAIRGGVAVTVRLWQQGLAPLVPNHRGSSGPSGLATRLNPRNVVLDVQQQPYYPDLIIYVSDSGTDRVHQLHCGRVGGDSQSTALGSVRPFGYGTVRLRLRHLGSVGGYGTADGELISPGALALGEADDTPLLFVSEGDRVSCFDADSPAFRFRFGRRGEACGEFRSPAGLVVHGGEVLVCDRLNHRVQAFAAADGAFRRAFGRRGTAPGEFAKPDSVAVARGRLVVGEYSNKRVQVLSLHGVPLQLLTALAGGVPARMCDFAVDETGGRVHATSYAPAAPLHTFSLVGTVP